MHYDPLHHHRRSIRLKGYDYASAGAYFVTICAQHRALLFEPEAVGTMIQRWWDKLPEKFLNVETDAFVIMPNHIHGIIVLAEAKTIEADRAVGADPRVGPEEGQTDDTRRTHNTGQTHNTRRTHNTGQTHNTRRTHNTGQTHGFAPTDAGEQTGQGTHVGVPLPTVVQWFKTMTTNEYIRRVKELGWVPFPGKLWQRNYYEHIVRNERELNAIRQYIADNPLKWALDRDNPTHFPQRPPPETVGDYLRDAGIS